MQITRKLIAISLTATSGIATALNFVLAADQPAPGAGVTGRIKTGLAGAAGASGFAQSETDLPRLIGNLINQGFGILGVLLLCLMLYGGFLWMTAAGEPDKVKKSIAVIRNAIIGLLIIVMAYALANFVIVSLGNAATQGAVQ